MANYKVDPEENYDHAKAQSRKDLLPLVTSASERTRSGSELLAGPSSGEETKNGGIDRDVLVFPF